MRQAAGLERHRWAEPAHLRAPGLVLIGAASRDAGKTELACSLLQRLSAEHELVGLKVTPVDDTEGPCPRGGAGCGVCSALAVPFVLTEEQDQGAHEKDTQRMRASGARRVFWLRARRAALAEGAAALLEQLGPDTCCIGESNSLRQVVEPGLFLLVRRSGVTRVKASAQAVQDQVDLEVVSDGQRFEPDPALLRLAGDPWSWQRPATAIVLAGGRSRRMGQDKAMLPLDGQPLIRRIVDRLAPHFAEILISGGATPERYAFLGRPVVPDRSPGCGPLMGLASTLAASSHETNLVVPCDVPDLPVWLIRRLLRAAQGQDGAALLDQDGRWEPLLAVYHRRLLPRLEAALAAGERRIISFFSSAVIRGVPLPPEVALSNLNTPEEYAHCLTANCRSMEP